MLRIRLDIEHIAAITSQTSSQRAQERIQLRKEISTGLASHRDGVIDHLNGIYRQVDQRITKLEGMLQVQADQVQQSPMRSMGVAQRALPTCRKRIHQCYQESPEIKEIDNPRSEGVCVRLRRQTSHCPIGCNCICHATRKASTPAMVDRVLGQLYFSYAGLPFLTANCDAEGCRKSQSPWISLEYWFPLGYFWSQIHHLQVTYQSNIGPQAPLSTLRRVPDTALGIKYALTGNIEGLKGLFTRGLASPVDVCSTRGYSLLSVSTHCFLAGSRY